MYRWRCVRTGAGRRRSGALIGGRGWPRLHGVIHAILERLSCLEVLRARAHQRLHVGDDRIGVEVLLIDLHVGAAVGEGADRGEAVDLLPRLAEETVHVAVHLRSQRRRRGELVRGGVGGEQPIRGFTRYSWSRRVSY